MRIADKMQFNQVQQNTTKNRSDMYDLQNQAATQKRINKPSDDPLATTRVLGTRTEERGNTQFVKNINNAKSFLEFTDQSLSELGDIMIRAKELAVAQSSDAGASEETRQVTGLEVNQILSQAVQIGNRKMGDRFSMAAVPLQQNAEAVLRQGKIRRGANDLFELILSAANTCSPFGSALWPTAAPSFFREHQHNGLTPPKALA